MAAELARCLAKTAITMSRAWSRTGFLLLRRDLDEAQSSEQKNSFNNQQRVTDFVHLAAFRLKRIEPERGNGVALAPTIFRHAPTRLQERPALFALKGVVLIQCSLVMGEKQFVWPNRPAAVASGPLPPESAPLPALAPRIPICPWLRSYRREPPLLMPARCATASSKWTLAAGFEDHSLSGIENSISINLFFSRQNNPLLFRPTSRISFPTGWSV